ncbi:hypothetical protein GCM10017044_23370 [Kordiimonas sediminis]|uniref:YicC family protein n=1 Tax=Kordiimonas sediminis TaxID=1735581 RepID=A0A919E9F7_9PROT|nr:YicC/YloC family endoribonuclease [Kordiimonas sediminis]GHF27616.1 hypothetical protein GCM10017044_23370 [Kordiimonas sediminis]
MTIKSMTGFSRSSNSGAGFTWTMELKSVNNKGLDIRTKLPSFLDGFDLTLKKHIGKKLARGSVFFSLNCQQDGGSEKCHVDEDRLKTLFDVAQKYKDVEGVTPASLDGLLAVKGVVEILQKDITDSERKDLETLLLTEVDACLDQLVTAREDEGQRMENALRDQIKTITALTTSAKEAAHDRIQSMRDRFASQLEKLSGIAQPVPEERLAQEVAMLAVKADIREEIDRLYAHIEEAISLLDSGKPIGRRLDFLCQEFNREANTLCSKAGDVSLTRIGLDLKTTIDQFREQVQNIE